MLHSDQESEFNVSSRAYVWSEDLLSSHPQDWEKNAGQPEILSNDWQIARPYGRMAREGES